MENKLLAFIILPGVVLFTFSIGRAQETAILELKGKVLAGISNKPVGEANVVLMNNGHVGGATDSLGYFHLRVPKEFLWDTLRISHVGYRSLILPLNTLPRNDGVQNFLLQNSAIVLDEVVVKDEEEKLRQLVLRAFKKIPDNYPDQPHLLHGFYRKISTEQNLYTHLEEASVSIEDYNYKRLPANVKIRVNAFRGTEDKGKIDREVVQSIAKYMQEHGGTQNNLYRLYDWNYSRLFNKENTVFNFKYLRDHIQVWYSFRLMNIEIVDGDSIFQVAYRSVPPYPPPPSGLTYLKINASNLAIVEFQNTGVKRDLSIYSQLFVRYQRRQGRYYPMEIRVTEQRFINKTENDGEYDIATYWFDKVEVKDFKGIPQRDVADRNSPDSAPVTYDPIFWKNYAGLKKHPLDRNILQVLEKDGPLSGQFKAK